LALTKADGPPFSWNGCNWSNDPWYNAERDGVEHMYPGRKGEKVVQLDVIDFDFKLSVDVE
jgi:hypothetical protein